MLKATKASPEPKISFDLLSLLKESTIDGLEKTFEKKSNFCNLSWFALHILCLILLCILCYSNCTRYLKYEIQTTMKVASQEEVLGFPSIVFCTTSVMRSSVLYSQFDYTGIYFALMSKWSSEDKLLKTRQWINRTCKKDINYPYNINTMFDFKNMDMMIQKLALAYDDIVLLCWSGRKLVPCKEWRVFDQTFNDLGACFTFNGFPNITSIVSDDSNSLIKATGIGREHGFRFLMNVHQEEYCVMQNSFNGIGVLFDLRENYAPLSFNSEKGFRRLPELKIWHPMRIQSNTSVSEVLLKWAFLPVGYETGVNIRLTQFIRNTEHLGRCVNKKLVDSDGQNPTPYYFGLCTAKAITKGLYEQCGCILPTKDTFIPYINTRNFDLIGFPLNYSFEKDCRNMHKYGMCPLVLLQKLFQNQFWSQAPYCPLPCKERSFSMTFDTKKLNPNFLLGGKNSTENLIVKDVYKDLAKQINITFERWVERNLVLVDFYYGSSNVYVFIDNQAYIWSDLLIDIANSCGLFYGLSFLTFFELLYFLLKYIIFAAKNYSFSRR